MIHFRLNGASHRATACHVAGASLVRLNSRSLLCPSRRLQLVSKRRCRSGKCFQSQSRMRSDGICFSSGPVRLRPPFALVFLRGAVRANRSTLTRRRRPCLGSRVRVRTGGCSAVPRDPLGRIAPSASTVVYTHKTGTSELLPKCPF